MGSLPIARYLSSDGTTTGTKNANGDYSDGGLGLTEWYLEAAAGETLIITRLLVTVEDTMVMQAQEYGNLGSALSNGIEVKVVDHEDNVMTDLTDGVPIIDNSHWAQMCYDADIKAWGSGNEMLAVRWTFAKHEKPVVLQPGWRLVVYLHDDLDGLINHYFVAEGH